MQAGDELLGVEELDFEAERWGIDQLVSYMRELGGVVILYMMRGNGPLIRASPSDVEAAMSDGVPQADESIAEGGGDREGSGGGNRSGKREGTNTSRLLEVLKEEKLLKLSESADTARLYCQISDRARQWDTGELWLSVAGLALRPSPEAVAAFASQWEPGEPPGWDESDSSEGGDSRSSHASHGDHDDASDKDRNDRLLTATTNTEFGDENGHVDLDTIGTALLGQPLFSDTLSAAATAVAMGAPAARRSLATNSPDTDGTDWSPWPQLAALENKPTRRDTVVPTQGLRKALSVRVLGQVEHGKTGVRSGDGGAPAEIAKKKNGKNNKSNDSSAFLQSTPYLVWVMDVESGAEWRVRRTHAEFAELWEVCTGMRPSLARLDFPSWLPEVKETPGMVEARRPR